MLRMSPSVSSGELRKGLKSGRPAALAGRGLWWRSLRKFGSVCYQLAWWSVPSVRWGRAGGMLSRNPGE
jgi:hypothetical protein